MWVIVVADITMSVDNVLAVAGASKGNLFLLIFGLGLSIPFVVFTSSLLSMLMDKYPYIIYIGAADPRQGRGGNDHSRTPSSWSISTPRSSSSTRWRPSSQSG